MIRKTDVWVAKFIDYDEEGKAQYAKPVCHELKLNTPNGYSDIQSFGDNIVKMRKAMVNYDQMAYFTEKDVAYIDITPEREEYNGQKANYVVDAVLPQNLKVAVFFKKL